MTTEYDYKSMLATYLRHVMRIERGSDLLSPDHGAPFAGGEIAEMRRLAGTRQANPSAPLVERTGGVTTIGDKPPGRSWFSELNSLPHDDREAETAERTDGKGL